MNKRIQKKRAATFETIGLFPYKGSPRGYGGVGRLIALPISATSSLNKKVATLRRCYPTAYGFVNTNGLIYGIYENKYRERDRPMVLRNLLTGHNRKMFSQLLPE